MNPQVFLIPVAVVGAIWLAMVILNERLGLFRDAFPTPLLKILAYLWLGLLMLVLTVLVVASAVAPPEAKDMAKVPFYSLFTMHAILILFLAGWWALAGRPPLRRFLNIGPVDTDATMIGFSVGLGGWALTIATAAMIAVILQATGMFKDPPQPSPMIAWMVALPLWKKALIVLAAMTVEEAFFRGWLQKRIGLVASTILFAVAHAGYSQPFLLVGVTLISLIIGFTFYRTKSIVPGVIAHGVFDAIQLFVIIPIAFRAAGLDG